jgi:hypothetical protein
VDSFKRLAEYGADFAWSLDMAATAVFRLTQRIEGNRKGQDEGLDTASFAPAIRGLKNDESFQDPLGFNNAGFAAPRTSRATSNKYDINISVTPDEMEHRKLATLIGKVVVEKVQEANDRGTGTTDTTR